MTSLGGGLFISSSGKFEGLSGTSSTINIVVQREKIPALGFTSVGTTVWVE